MEFVIDLLEEEQIRLETVEAAVSTDERIDFAIEGSITDPGSETLAALQGEEVRPVSVTFETVT